MMKIQITKYSRYHEEDSWDADGMVEVSPDSRMVVLEADDAKIVVDRRELTAALQALGDAEA